jgi:hypothetical protein
MTVGDKGVIYSIDLGGYNATGNTAVFLAAPGTEPDAIGKGLRLSPMTILDGGLTAVYQTTGTDLQESGPWQVAVEVTTPDGRVFTSAIGQIYVNPLLAN